ncbi:DUF3617 domain-containing protein [Rheinheimera pleomorphica]|uniref:DUF3617 domain-containing protein n=1 Tax=Rheinheimera pleomorphica TaxID=2703963 RepID=UPI001423C38E|nr:DUF3617 domain-containing protein [Rheinheimera pleomorphica]
MKATAILLSLFVSSATLAAPTLEMEPGRWQHSFTLQSADGELERAMAEMQKQLAAMPAQQRQMMEAMMQSQGMAIGQNGGSIEVCLSADDIAKGQLPQQDGCQQQLTEQNGSFKISFQCNTKPPSKGEGEFRLLNRKAYEGQLRVNTTHNGKPQQMTMQQQGKWLGPCS